MWSRRPGTTACRRCRPASARHRASHSAPPSYRAPASSCPTPSCRGAPRRRRSHICRAGIWAWWRPLLVVAVASFPPMGQVRRDRVVHDLCPIGESASATLSLVVLACDQRPQPGQEKRQLFGCGLPDDFMIDIKISVDQPIAHRDDQRPGNVGSAVSRGDALTLLPASPTISIALTSAKTSIRSASKSLRGLPETKPHAVSAASILWSRRIRSSGGKLDLSRSFDCLAEMRTEFICGPQVYRPAEER